MRSFLITITRDPLGLAGAALTSASAVLFLVLYGIDLTVAPSQRRPTAVGGASQKPLTG